MIWTPIILGVIIFSVFNSSFFVPPKYMQWSMFGAIGGILIGWGFGLAYSKKYDVEGLGK